MKNLRKMVMTVSIPYRYGITLALKYKMPFGGKECQFLIGTVLQEILLEGSSIWPDCKCQFLIGTVLQN